MSGFSYTQHVSQRVAPLLPDKQKHPLSDPPRSKSIRVEKRRGKVHVRRSTPVATRPFGSPPGLQFGAANVVKPTTSPPGLQFGAANVVKPTSRPLPPPVLLPAPVDRVPAAQRLFDACCMQPPRPPLPSGPSLALTIASLRRALPLPSVELLRSLSYPQIHERFEMVQKDWLFSPKNPMKFAFTDCRVEFLVDSQVVRVESGVLGLPLPDHKVLNLRQLAMLTSVPASSIQRHLQYSLYTLSHGVDTLTLPLLLSRVMCRHRRETENRPVLRRMVEKDRSPGTLAVFLVVSMDPPLVSDGYYHLPARFDRGLSGVVTEGMKIASCAYKMTGITDNTDLEDLSALEISFNFNATRPASRNSTLGLQHDRILTFIPPGSIRVDGGLVPHMRLECHAVAAPVYVEGKTMRNYREECEETEKFLEKYNEAALAERERKIAALIEEKSDIKFDIEAEKEANTRFSADIIAECEKRLSKIAEELRNPEVTVNMHREVEKRSVFVCGPYTVIGSYVDFRGGCLVDVTGAVPSGSVLYVSSILPTEHGCGSGRFLVSSVDELHDGLLCLRVQHDGAHHTFCGLRVEFDGASRFSLTGDCLLYAVNAVAVGDRLHVRLHPYSVVNKSKDLVMDWV